jgi:hypothetical protein
MEIRVLIGMNRIRMSVLNQENNTSILDLEIETQHSIFNWMFPGRLVDEKAMQ